MAIGGFKSALPLPFAVGGGTIVPVSAGASTPVIGRDLVSLLNIRKEIQKLREGPDAIDFPTKPKRASDFGRNLAQALNALQEYSNTTDRRLRQLALQQNNVGVSRDPGGNLAFSCATFAVRAGNQNFLLANGRMLYGVANTPPIDNDIPNGHVTAYLDELGNSLIFRVKYSDGTVKSGTVALV